MFLAPISALRLLEGLYVAFPGLVAVVAVALAPETAARGLTSITGGSPGRLSPGSALSSG
ncbi:hypothetical protein GCM10017673_29440 [Streptosporangium violaceochromogenes]|nr:hypothetical protein GCM10017673_29440 [Streptosporangium violaceochromogenes]